MGSLTGKIVAVDSAKGFITCDKGVSHFFTPNKVAADQPFVELSVGDLVDFEAYAAPKGMRARKIKKRETYPCWEIASDFRTYTKKSGLTMPCDGQTYGVPDLELHYVYDGDLEKAKRELFKLLKDTGYNFVQGLESWKPADEQGGQLTAPVLTVNAGVYFTNSGVASSAQEQEEAQKRIEHEADEIRKKGQELADRISKRKLWTVTTLADRFIILGDGKTFREDEVSLSSVDLVSTLSRDKHAGREQLIQSAQKVGANCIENLRYSTLTANEGNYHYTVFQWHCRAHQYGKVTYTEVQSEAEAQHAKTKAQVDSNHERLIDLQKTLNRLVHSKWKSTFVKVILIGGLVIFLLSKLFG